MEVVVLLFSAVVLVEVAVVEGAVGLLEVQELVVLEVELLQVVVLEVELLQVVVWELAVG